MWKYIVTWVLVNVVPVDCPDAGKTDDFGRKSNMNGSCSVYHTKNVEENQKKEFFKRSDAFDFYYRSKEESKKTNLMGIHDIKFVKIDSVKIEDIKTSKVSLKDVMSNDDYDSNTILFSESYDSNGTYVLFLNDRIEISGDTIMAMNILYNEFKKLQDREEKLQNVIDKSINLYNITPADIQSTKQGKEYEKIMVDFGYKINRPDKPKNENKSNGKRKKLQCNKDILRS